MASEQDDLGYILGTGGAAPDDGVPPDTVDTTATSTTDPTAASFAADPTALLGTGVEPSAADVSAFVDHTGGVTLPLEASPDTSAAAVAAAAAAVGLPTTSTEGATGGAVTTNSDASGAASSSQGAASSSAGKKRSAPPPSAAEAALDEKKARERKRILRNRELARVSNERRKGRIKAMEAELVDTRQTVSNLEESIRSLEAENAELKNLLENKS